MTPEFKKQWFRKKAHELPADAELVSCVPLGLVLEMFGISHIDFLSLDVEVMRGNSFVTKLGGPRTGHLPGCKMHSTSMVSVHRCCILTHPPDRDGGLDAIEACQWLVFLLCSLKLCRGQNLRS